MSKQFLRDLHNNSVEEYLKLKRELSVIQKGKCMFCGNKLDPESGDCHITCTSSRRKFHIEDYILCHNGCDADHKKTVLWEQSIKPVVVSIGNLDADKFDDDPFEKEFHDALKIIHDNCQINTDKDFIACVNYKLHCVRGSILTREHIDSSKVSSLYLGIHGQTLMPFIECIEALDNCYVYKLEDILTSISVKRGYDGWADVYVKDESILKSIISQYLNTSETNINVFKTYAETKLSDKDYETISEKEANELFLFVGERYMHCRTLPIQLAKRARYLMEERRKEEAKEMMLLKYGDKITIYKNNREYASAIKYLNKYLDLSPKNVWAFSSIADCYRLMKDKENQIKTLNIGIEVTQSKMLQLRLKHAMGIKNVHILSKESYEVFDAEDWGGAYEKHITEKMPEYNFYYNNFNPFKHFNFEAPDMLPVIRRIDSHFSDLYRDASEAITNEDIEQATEIYEQLIAENVYNTKAYEELMKIYKKLKRTQDVIRVLSKGIDSFSAKIERQKAYLRKMARKYNAVEYCERCFELGLKIQYYCGYIILYKPMPIIDKWKKMLVTYEK